jgi:hypothetical protein
MRWMLIGLLVSVGALLLAGGAMVRHILRQRRVRVEEALEASATAQPESEHEPGLSAVKKTQLEEPSAKERLSKEPDTDSGSRGGMNESK